MLNEQNNHTKHSVDGLENVEKSQTFIVFIHRIVQQTHLVVVGIAPTAEATCMVAPMLRFSLRIEEPINTLARGATMTILPDVLQPFRRLIKVRITETVSSAFHSVVVENGN